MHISINTDEPLSNVDKQILSVLAGDSVAPAAKPKPAKAATPVKVTKAEPEEEDSNEEDSNPAGASPEEAVALATKMVSNGEAAKVKKALGAVGAKKVSEIPADKVDEFIAELS